VLAAAGIGVVLAAAFGSGASVGHGIAEAAGLTPPATSSAAAKAIAYARGRIGCPYVYGGNGPCSAGYDCSGILQQAWAAAGVSIPRTADEQWLAERHVPAGRAPIGSSVFAPGGDGSWSAPGHVGMLVAPGRVLEAFETGTNIFITSLAQFSATSGGIIGYAVPR
jgi:cell wall-associated NlpC family hydrolase